MNDNPVELVLKCWRSVTEAVAVMPAGFVGRGKETRVFGRLRQEIEATVIGAQIFGPDSQLRFCRWGIDLVYETREGRLAVEGKYKILSDGAVPDNRKAAFFDLYKLEKYVASGGYVAGLFLWLTDEPGYRQQASGDSADFSTHDGRLYNAGAQLNAARSRNPMPLPLALKRSYKFNWNPVEKLGQWYSLAILVDGDAG